MNMTIIDQMKTTTFLQVSMKLTIDSSIVVITLKKIILEMLLKSLMIQQKQRKSVGLTTKQTIYSMYPYFIIQVFNVKLNQKLSSHEKEFMIAYKEQMTHVQSELRSLKAKIDEETLKQKSDQKLKILEEERDYFRSEALRLDKLCKEQSQLLEEYKFKINLSKEEKSYYEGFVIETKKENNSLKLELINLYQQKSDRDANYARNRIHQLKSASSIKNTTCKGSEVAQYRIQSHKNLKSERKDQFFNTQPQGFGVNNKMGLQYEQRENMNGLEDLNTQLVNLKTNNQKNEDLIHHLLLKKEQDKQKAKEYKHIYNQLIIDRSELEEILVSCIQEIKKDIIKRKQLDKNFNQKLKQNLELISLENFQATDKKKLLLTFMSDDKILESLYYLTFGVKEDEQNNKLSKNWRFSVADANKKYKQFKKTVDKMNLSKQNEKCQIDALSVEKQALEASYRPRRPKILQIRSNKSDIQYILMSESLRKSLLNPKDNEDEDYQMTDLANSKIFSNKMRSQTERPEFMSNIKKIDTSQIDRNITANLFQQELSVYSINNNFIQNNETLYNNLIDQNMRKNSHVRNDLSDYQIDENISGELNSRNISLNSQMQSPNPNNCISSQQLGSISSIDLKIAQKQQEKPQKTLNKQHKVKQLNKPMKKIQLHSYDLSNKIWQQSKEHGLYRVLFIFLLYLVPICRKIYMFKFKTFQTYIESVWILHINDQWKNFKNHAVTTEEQKLQSLIEYYILILIFTELIFKLLQFKILFQHRHKKWSNERVSHKLNRFDRFLFTNERIEMYFTTCLNDMTLNMNQYRKRVCASNKNPLFKPIMLRILVIVLPFEISIIPYLLDLSNNSKKCQYIQKVLILYSFIYRSCEYPFQISMIYKSSMRCIESEFLFNSFFSIILINGFDLACFIGVTLYLYLSRDFLVNRKSIKNALIT